MHVLAALLLRCVWRWLWLLCRGEFLDLARRGRHGLAQGGGGGG
jgi:hypothetical protein